MCEKNWELEYLKFGFNVEKEKKYSKFDIRVE